MAIQMPVILLDKRGRCQECPHTLVEVAGAAECTTHKSIHPCHMRPKQPCIGHAYSEQLVKSGVVEYSGDLVMVHVK